MEDNIKIGVNAPPFPGEEAMRDMDERFHAWAHSEEGRAFLKEHLSPEAYQKYFGDEQ